MGYKRLYIKIYTKKDSGIMASVTIPYSFTNGYAADANEVNANFAALKAFVDASLVQTDGSKVNAATSITKAMLVAAVQESIAPAGSILLYGGSSAPTGWLICNGATLSTTTYAALFAVVGYTYGGSGGNFLLPSMANKFAFGGTPGVGGGSATILEANLPIHSHNNSASSVATSHSHTISPPATEYPSEGVSVPLLDWNFGDSGNLVSMKRHNIFPTSTAAESSHTHTINMTNASTGSGTAYYQPHVVFNYIIKS